MKKMKFYIPVLLVSFLLTGCYTQLAMKSSNNNYPNESQDNGDNYSEAPADTEGYYTDNQPSDSNYDNEQYSDNEDGVVNNYYVGAYPYYQRYYWGYYPSIDFGFNFGYSFYDPYCWNNFYYGPWCGSYYYPPYYSYSYYNPWYYYSGYSYPYYSGYYYGGNYHGHGIYRERSKDSYRLRNNNGLRSSYTSRGSLTRDNNTSLSKKAGVSDRNINTIRNSTRHSVYGRSSNDLRKSSINNRTRESNIIRNSTRNSVSRRSGNYLRKSSVNTRTRESNIIRKRNTSLESIRKNGTNRNDGQYRKGVNRSYRESRPSGRSGVRGQGRHYNNTRTYSPPQRSYNPPQRSYSPPSRSYSHPESRGGGGSSRGGGRSSGGGRRR